jgi:hypothetical protein
MSTDAPDRRHLLPPASVAVVVTTVLLVAIAVDVVLPVLAFASPSWWFDTLHVGRAPDALHVALLQRAAAQWIAFAALQLVALARWRRWPHWLLLVAGARTSDWLTDLTYLCTMPDPSPLRWTLLAPPLLNIGMSLLLFVAWRQLTERAAASAHSA